MKTDDLSVAELLTLNLNLVLDPVSGGPNSTALPTYNFSVRQLTAVFWPGDGRTYVFGDIVPFQDPTLPTAQPNKMYPNSWSQSIGAFSSADGLHGWVYHGDVLHRYADGPGWDTHAASMSTPSAVVVTRSGVPQGLSFVTSTSKRV